MRVFRTIPKSLWLWASVWLVALALLLPVLRHYGESQVIDHRADHLLLALMSLSMPASYGAGAFVAVMRPVTRVVVDPEAGADFVLTLLWWFTAGYMQWFLLLYLLRLPATDRPAKPDAPIDALPAP